MKKFLKSFVNATNGISASLRGQRNLRVQVFIALCAVAGGFYFDISGTEWCMILLCIGLVIGLEMMNSALEGLVDLVTSEWKPLAGKVKDVAAGAVLFATVIAVIIGLIIFTKYVTPS